MQHLSVSMQSDDMNKNVRKSHSCKRTAFDKREKIGKAINGGFETKSERFYVFHKGFEFEEKCISKY